MSTILTGADVRILDVIDRDAGRCPLVLLLPTNVDQNSRDKQEDPEE